MALDVSVRASLLAQQTNIKQQIILEIPALGGILFGAAPIYKFIRYGEDDIYYGQEGLVYGGVIEIENSKPYIMLEGTTNNITQQLEVDQQGSSTSITKFKIQMVDKDQFLTKLFSPGFVINDLLGQEATVYLGFDSGAFPEDAIRIFSGVIDLTKTGPGYWNIQVSQPQGLLKSEIFTQISTELSSPINDSTLTIPVKSTVGLLEPTDILRTAVRIEDEIIEYSSFTSTQINAISRAAENSLANPYDADAELTSFYILEGDPIDIALKIMLSRDQNKPSAEDKAISRFVQTDGTNQLQNSVTFVSDTLQDDFGLSVGDLVTITGATNPANNITNSPITAFIPSTEGTIIVFSSENLVLEIETTAVASFRSQFDVLPVTRGGVSAGANMKTSQVDVAKFLSLKQLLFSQLPNMKHYISEGVEAKSFLDNELFKPTGFYSVPKARFSLAATIPPLVVSTLKQLNEEAVKSPDKQVITRGINRNFYNAINYKFNNDSIEDGKLLNSEVIFSQKSVDRIETNNKPLTIEAKGMRNDADTVAKIQSITRRFIDRWQFAPEAIESAQVTYREGFSIEISDIVLYGSPELKLTDINNATRNFKPRLMEVTNKSVNLKTGDIKLSLLDTKAGADSNVGVISPNSLIESATISRLTLKASYGNTVDEVERTKWENFIGETIRIRDENYTFAEDVLLIGFDPSDLKTLLITDLSLAPPENYIVDLPLYPLDTDPDVNAKMKDIHCFWTPQVDVTSTGTNATFIVGAGDIGKFLVGAFVVIHNDDYTRYSQDSAVDDYLEITSVDTGANTVTVNNDIGFVTEIGDRVDMIGFPDGGLAYTFI